MLGYGGAAGAVFGVLLAFVFMGYLMFAMIGQWERNYRRDRFGLYGGRAAPAAAALLLATAAASLMHPAACREEN